MTDTELVERWKMPARRDDVLNKMVPSDIRQIVGAIERQMTRADAAEAENKRLREALEIISEIKPRGPFISAKEGMAEHAAGLKRARTTALAALSKGDG